ncbi:DUF6152 family protein [Piscinibacter koreensis]|uniref:Uncharacterized protein n=1 Tax=Piscinibacter koreensis TaxID=2742824 RepID=A0A7Y6NL84_9BURK|nr:DUF6152 family protein [Schlegelella koreensis]NUZ05258.1 hypothetical protein [Schlegelella koreensis]
MQRRTVLTALAAWPAGAALAHHGWSSFDQDRPLYLEGVARNVAWRNPHAEFDLEVPADLRVPADLARRPVPAQSASVDGARVLAEAKTPTRRDKVWHVELSPLTRLQAWKVPEIRNGDRVSMVGFTFAGEKGEPVLRVEYLFVGASTYGLRSSPA